MKKKLQNGTALFLLLVLAFSAVPAALGASGVTERRCQLIYYDFYLLKKLARRQKVYSYNCSVSSDTRKANAKSKF